MSTFTRFLTFTFLTFVSLSINAQVKTKTFDGGIPGSLLPTKESDAKKVIIQPSSEFYKLKQQTVTKTQIKDKNKLVKFSLPTSINIDLLNEGTFSENNGISTYALTITAKDAVSLFIQFSKFILSENAILSIYNNYELTDSITAKENNESNMWVTRVYKGNTLNIVLKLPSKEVAQSSIKISSVYLGYKQVGGRFGNPGASEDCNINVVCPTGLGWEAERNSVAIINGVNGFASGVLVMNTCNLNIPYLLTAKHVLDQAGPVANWVFQFFYFSTTCDTNTGFREDIQFNGATVKASYGPSDFALVQLNQVPPANSGITYSGWNRGAIPATNFRGIHHPNADVMKISRSTFPIMRNAGGNPFYDPTQFWQINWSQGITAQGSSGSPLFDQNHRIIGQLTDGQSFCATPTAPDWYGSFDRSWLGGGTNSTRLSNWLNPNNSGAVTTNTTGIINLNASPIPGRFLSITGNSVVCGTTQAYTINGVISGATVVWQLLGPEVGSGYQIPYQNVCTKLDNGSQTTLTKLKNGNLRLFATITHCNGVVEYAGKNITFGVPSPSYNGAYASNISYYKPITGTVSQTDGYNTWINMAYPSNTQYTWTKTGGSSNVTWSSQFNGEVNILFSRPVNSTSNITFSLNSSNACGSGSSPVVFYYNGPPLYSVFPNPVSNKLNIELVEDTRPYTIVNEKQRAEGLRKIQIVDKSGIVIFTKNYVSNSKKVNVDISHLKPDVYIVRIYHETSIEEHKIIVQHR